MGGPGSPLGDNSHKTLYLGACFVPPELDAKLGLLRIKEIGVGAKTASTGRAIVELRVAEPLLQRGWFRTLPKPTKFG